MRLLLDEHLARDIVEQLRERGFDVVAVAERPDLRAASDEQLIDVAMAERRAIVTENVRDFIPLMRTGTASGEHHYGLVLTSSRSMPRNRGTIGLFVQALELLLAEHPEVDALLDQIRWLHPEG